MDNIRLSGASGPEIYLEGGIKVYKGMCWPNPEKWLHRNNMKALLGLAGHGTEHLFVPRPFRMNGEIEGAGAWPHMETYQHFKVGRCTIHYGVEVDGTYIDLTDSFATSSALTLVTADCPAAVVVGRRPGGELRVIFCHLGRDSVHDVLNKRAGMSAISTIAESIDPKTVSFVGIYCGISKDSFVHDMNDTRYAEKNRKMWSFFSKYCPSGARELANSKVAFDMPEIVRCLLMMIGVPKEVISVDGINTATDPTCASNVREGLTLPRRNVVLVYPFETMVAVS